MHRSLTFVCLFLLSRSGFGWSTLDDWATVVATQIATRQPLPVLSTYGAGLSLVDAYEVQKRVVQRLAAPEDIAGFKASLTRPLGQVQYDVREPITGVVLKAGLLKGEVALRLRDFKRLTIAPGLAFVIKKRIDKPLNDMAQLAPLIGTVMPVIDFSDFRFERDTGMNASDLVAGNTAFARLLLGKPLAASDPATVNGVLVELSHYGTVVDRGRAVNVMGNQYTALYWLINKLLMQGWELPAGTILVTGGFSDPVTARLGEYVAKYWDETELKFTVER